MENYEDLIARINKWMNKAAESEPNDPNAACLGTATKDGRPSARMVLIKNIHPERHIVFYTNHTSRKADELLENPYAAMTIHWKTTGRQIRLEGQVETVSDEEADHYFARRSRGSQIGAWASDQSSPLDSREELEKRYHDIETQYEGKEIPRPPHWSGFRIIPFHIEFWQDGTYRLHNREVYEPAGDSSGKWSKILLNP